MMNRRTFLVACAAVTAHRGSAARARLDIETIEHERVLRNAKKYLADKPQTVTAAQSKRSTGGAHDFFSEGDYWWPDPKNPDGPYIQRDGMTNTNNFVAHRHAMVRLSEVVGTMT